MALTYFQITISKKKFIHFKTQLNHSIVSQLLFIHTADRSNYIKHLFHFSSNIPESRYIMLRDNCWFSAIHYLRCSRHFGEAKSEK